MGNCLYVLNQRDLSGSTFSHYSLTSSSSFLDLYPTLSYVETEQDRLSNMSTQSSESSRTRSGRTEWRRSSAPLLDTDGSPSSRDSSQPTVRAKMLKSSSSGGLRPHHGSVRHQPQHQCGAGHGGRGQGHGGHAPSATSVIKSCIRASTTQLLARDRGLPVIFRKSVTVESTCRDHSSILVINSSVTDTMLSEENERLDNVNHSYTEFRNSTCSSGPVEIEELDRV